MIQYDGSSIDTEEEYYATLKEFGRLAHVRDQFEREFNQVQAKYEDCWYRLCLLREQRERKGN